MNRQALVAALDHAFPPRPERSIEVDDHGVRRIANHIAFALAVAVAVLVTLQASGMYTAIPVAVFMLTVPGWTLVSRWQLDDLTVEATVSVALSIAINTAVSVVMVWAGWFEPRWSTAAIAAVCALPLGRSLRSRCRHGHEPPLDPLRDDGVIDVIDPLDWFDALGDGDLS